MIFLLTGSSSYGEAAFDATRRSSPALWPVIVACLLRH
jgi:hypothetical protein